MEKVNNPENQFGASMEETSDRAALTSNEILRETNTTCTYLLYEQQHFDGILLHSQIYSVSSNGYNGSVFGFFVVVTPRSTSLRIVIHWVLFFPFRFL